MCSVSACHTDVVKIVELAVKHNVVIIPFGGEFHLSQFCKGLKPQLLSQNIPLLGFAGICLVHEDLNNGQAMYKQEDKGSLKITGTQLRSLLTEASKCQINQGDILRERFCF